MANRPKFLNKMRMTLKKLLVESSLEFFLGIYTRKEIFLCLYYTDNMIFPITYAVKVISIEFTFNKIYMPEKAIVLKCSIERGL